MYPWRGGVPVPEKRSGSTLRLALALSSGHTPSQAGPVWRPEAPQAPPSAPGPPGKVNSKRLCLFASTEARKNHPYVQPSLVNQGATKVLVRTGDLHNTAVSSRFRKVCETVRVHRRPGGEADLGQNQFVLETEATFLCVVQCTYFSRLLCHHGDPIV